LRSGTSQEKDSFLQLQLDRDGGFDTNMPPALFSLF
jgi:hypothetical protein